MKLRNFGGLADLYARKTETAIVKELQLEELVEICHDQKSQV
jgi:hypothetical protein